MVVIWNASLPVDFYNQMTEKLSALLNNEILNTYEISANNAYMASLYSELFAAMTLATMRWWLTEAPFLSNTEIIEIITANIEKGLFLSMEETYL